MKYLIIIPILISVAWGFQENLVQEIENQTNVSRASESASNAEGERIRFERYMREDFVPYKGIYINCGEECLTKIK